jgi:hypothetical protein
MAFTNVLMHILRNVSFNNIFFAKIISLLFAFISIFVRSPLQGFLNMAHHDVGWTLRA